MTTNATRLHATLHVASLRAAIDYYTTRLGFRLAFTWPPTDSPPNFAGVKLGEVEVFLSEGAPSPDGIALNFVVEDVDELFALHRDNGVVVDWEPGDREYGLRDYAVRDLDGYLLIFGQDI